MKVLNLDELAPEKRVLTIKGQTYEMKEMTVADFIKVTKEAEEADAAETKEGKKLALHEQVSRLVDAIVVAFPTCPKEVLEGLALNQLTAILTFVRGDIPEEIGTEEEGEAGNG